MSDEPLVPRQPPPAVGLLARLAEAAEAGSDEMVIITLGRMLSVGARPSEVAKEAGMRTDVVWALINESAELQAALAKGTNLRQMQTAEVVRSRLKDVVEEMANMVSDPEVPGPARVAAGKEFWTMAKDLGIVKPAAKQDGKVAVAVDGDFSGRFAVLIGGKDD